MKLIDLTLSPKAKKETNTPTKMSGPDYPYGTRVTLDKEHIAKLRLGGYNVGDECQILGHAKVTSKSSHARAEGEDHQSIELQIVKMGVGPIEKEHEESMGEYAKRRKAELRER